MDGHSSTHLHELPASVRAIAVHFGPTRLVFQGPSSGEKDTIYQGGYGEHPTDDSARSEDKRQAGRNILLNNTLTM